MTEPDHVEPCARLEEGLRSQEAQLWSGATKVGHASIVAFAVDGAILTTSVVSSLAAAEASDESASEAHLRVGPGSISRQGAS